MRCCSKEFFTRTTALFFVAVVAMSAQPCTVFAEDSCAALNGVAIPAESIGLPTKGANVSSAVLVPATPALGEYCLVKGVIEPTGDGFPINFQVNLPRNWDLKAMHYGGGGLNGTVVTGLTGFQFAPPNVALPLMKGYATFGSDSGHSNPPNQAGPDASFALNGEALVNFGYAQLKKTHDVAVELIKRRYGRPPNKMYFMGQSQGGHEGLIVAQHYPKDYDGIFSGSPVANFVPLQTHGILIGQQLAKPGGWLNPAKIALVANAEMAACDLQDGIKDGVISNWKSCRFDAATLRCPGGRDTGDACLSDDQVKTVNLIHSPLKLAFQLANGIAGIPAYPFGGELDQREGWQANFFGAEPPTGEPMPFNPAIGIAWTKSAIMKNPNADWKSFSPDAYRARLIEVSNITDSLDPDLSAFCGHGGKLILWVGMTDYKVSPYVGIDYYKSVVAKLGPTVSDRCVRIYVSPGLSHFQTSPTNEPNKFDFFTALEDWVQEGIEPGDLLAVSMEPKPPFTVTKSRPLCKGLTWPKYNGSGNPDLASSYTCVP